MYSEKERLIQYYILTRDAATFFLKSKWYVFERKKCNLNIYSTQWSISKCGGVRWQRLHCHLSLAEKDEKWFVVGRSAISTAKVLRVAISYYARLFLSLSAML